MAKRVNFTSSKSSSKYKFLNKNSGKKTAIFLAVLFVIIAGIVAFAGLTLYNHSKIDSAKTKISAFDKTNRVIQTEIVPNFDSDSDGVNNGDEQSNKTDYLSADTDGDGISDGDELILNTNPLKADSDDDGLIDSVEIAAGLDPNNKSTDGTDDINKKFTVTKTTGEITAEITGDATVYGAIVDVVNLTGFSANSSILTDAYEVYNKSGFDSCKLTFAISNNYVSSGVSVYKFNLEKGEFEKISSLYDPDAKTVSADISENGTYMVADDNTINSKTKTQVHFLIDNSGSMYPQEIIPNSPENDVDFKRLDFVKQLIAKFDDSYSVAISRFTKDYNYMQEFTTDKKLLSNVLDSIKTLDENFNGTYIQYSLEECIKSFKDTDEKTVRIIILVTDGDTTEEKSPDTDYIAKLAKEKNIIILTVSIGNNIDKSVLNNIAGKTDGKYYSASDANLLSQIHSQIVATLDYDKTDIGSSDSKYGYMMYNTGFVPSENGFGFEDYRTMNSDSMSLGLCIFARDWFVDKLRMSMSDVNYYSDEISGYNLKGTDFETLYKNRKKLRTISFIAVSTKRFTDSSEYLDFEGSKDEVLNISVNTRQDAYRKGWGNKRYELGEQIYKWNCVNLLALDIENNYDKIAEAYGKSEAEFYKAINRWNGEINNPTSFVNLSSGDVGFNTLCAKLRNGEPAVIIINGNYSLLVTSMIKNAENSGEYILKVYDPSDKDLAKELYITKTVGVTVDKNGTVTESKNFYSASYNSKDVSVMIYKN